MLFTVDAVPIPHPNPNPTCSTSGHSSLLCRCCSYQSLSFCLFTFCADLLLCSTPFDGVALTTFSYRAELSTCNGHATTCNRKMASALRLSATCRLRKLPPAFHTAHLSPVRRAISLASRAAARACSFIVGAPYSGG